MSTTYRVLSDQLYRSVALVTTANVVTEAYDTDAYPRLTKPFLH